MDAGGRHLHSRGYASVYAPLWDWLFGTYYLPDRWPNAYGLCDGGDVPKGWPRQLIYPLRRRRTNGQRSS